MYNHLAPEVTKNHIHAKQIIHTITLINSAVKYQIYLVKHMKSPTYFRGKWLELGYGN